jgi:hypothetical protein
LNQDFLLRIARAIAPLQRDAVIVGGVAHALLARHSLASPLPFPVVYTEDIDIGASEDLARRLARDSGVVDRLRREGIEERIVGATTPKLRYCDPLVPAHYAEFVAPRRGGDLPPPLRFGGVQAERLPSIDVLLHEPWPLDLDPVTGLQVWVANPVAYLYQKLLCIGERQHPRRKPKDWLYIYDTVTMFSVHWDTLIESVPTLLQPPTRARRRKVRDLISRVDSERRVLDEAAGIAASSRPSPPSPDDIAWAAKHHLGPLIEKADRD